MVNSEVEPVEVVEMVEDYVSTELRDARTYDNRNPLDESGIWSLHLLASRIYARGYEAGQRAEESRARAARRRESEERA